MIYYKKVEKNGNEPQSIKYRITPRLNMSTLSSKSSQFTIYGAMKPGVPANFYFGSMPLSVFLYTANPKSMILAF